jgi:hypothetical protein
MENAEKLKIIRNLFRDIFTNTAELSIITIAKLTKLFKVVNPGGPDESFSIELKGVYCYDQENADMVVEFDISHIPKDVVESFNDANAVVESIIKRKLTPKESLEFKRLFLQHEADIFGKINYALNVDWVSRIIIQIKKISEVVDGFDFTSWDDLVIEFSLDDKTYYIDIWNDYLVTDSEGNELDA